MAIPLWGGGIDTLRDVQGIDMDTLFAIQPGSRAARCRQGLGGVTVPPEKLRDWAGCVDAVTPDSPRVASPGAVVMSPRLMAQNNLKPARGVELSADDREELRRRFEGEYLGIAVGAERGATESLVSRYVAKGVTRRTVFRWIAAAKKSPATGEALVIEARRRRSARRALAKGDGPTEEIAALLPPVPTLADAEEMAAAEPGAPVERGQPGQRMTVMERLEFCLGNAEQVIRFAKTTDGEVRNAKLLLAASEHLRRSLETAAKLHQAMMEYSKAERFQDAILEEIGRGVPRGG